MLVPDRNQGSATPEPTAAQSVEFENESWREGPVGLTKDADLFRRARTVIAASESSLTLKELIADLADELWDAREELKAWGVSNRLPSDEEVAYMRRLHGIK